MIAADRLRISIEALKNIAALDNVIGNLELMKSHTFHGFDQPQAVKFARETLRAIKEPLN